MHFYKKTLAVVSCNAKINLSLKVLDKRLDGYHNIDSNIFFSNISDKITIKKINKKDNNIKLVITGPFSKELLNRKNKNLVYKAAKYLLKEFNINDSIKIILEKNLPVASGIGGGSANAAAILKTLPKVLKIENNKKLKLVQNEIARKLGSDITACLNSKPAKILETGTKLAKINVGLKRIIIKNRWLVLVTVNKKLSTKRIFNNLKKIIPLTKIPNKSPLTYSIGMNNLKNISEHLVPEIVITQYFLSKQKGIKFFGMSGSGPTCFGIFRRKEEAIEATLNILKIRPKWWIKYGQLLN